jgi:hypothetical protein
LQAASSAQTIAPWTKKPIRRAVRPTACLTVTPACCPACGAGGEAEWWSLNDRM